MKRKKYFRLPVDDSRDKRWFYGTQEEYEEYLQKGCYVLDSHSWDTRYYDGYMSSTAVLRAGPKDGFYYESGAFGSRTPENGLIHYDKFPLEK